MAPSNAAFSYITFPISRYVVILGAHHSFFFCYFLLFEVVMRIECVGFAAMNKPGERADAYLLIELSRLVLTNMHREDKRTFCGRKCVLLFVCLFCCYC